MKIGLSAGVSRAGWRTLIWLILTVGDQFCRGRIETIGGGGGGSSVGTGRSDDQGTWRTNINNNHHRNGNGHTNGHLAAGTVSGEGLGYHYHFDRKNDTGVKRFRLNLAVILPNDDTHPYSRNKVLPAIMAAVDKIRHAGDAGPFPHWDIHILYRDSMCSSTYGPLAAMDLFNKKSADVLFGPVCTYVLAPVARYNNVWKMPLLTSGGQNENFDAKSPHYKYLTRMNGSYSQLGHIFINMLTKFGWKVIGMLFHNYDSRRNIGNSACHFTLASLFSALGKSAAHMSFDETTPGGVDYKSYLHNISKNARIIVICASPDTVRNILLAAEELKMIDSGEYVFFNIELFGSNTDNHYPWKREGDEEKNNARAKKAYAALLTVAARTPTTEEYKNFSDKVKSIAKDEFNFDFGNETVNTFITAFYEAVWLYAIALNETLEDGSNITDGAMITSKMWNRTFIGITGNVSIDENGDRNADYSLLDMDPDTGKFEVVANYFGVSKQFVDVPGKTIHWAGGRTEPPQDTPTCGFDGSKCPDDEPFPEYAIVSIVLSTVVVILCIGSVFIYRHYKLEAELASMSWKIKFGDIICSSSDKPRRCGSRLSLHRNSMLSCYSVETLNVYDVSKQMFVRTGYYKGQIVALKKINKPRIEITRPLLLELKQVKDLQHDHIVRFIGACVDSPHSCIVTEYCPKGSLQDILENEQIKLDWMFRYSLMHDIVKGMAYLHHSDIRSHGNLKSSNCVVDSRFVLKVTDFGLHNLRDYDENENEDSYAYWRRKLWTAPELLRMLNPQPEGTQKGDVYSFAIIIHEIVFRQGPFFLENLELTPQEIVEHVRNGQKPCFRPSIDQDSCDEEVRQMMRKCWSEDPMERPDFQALKGIIRRLNKDNESGNILDNLLSRMEQYANNLESLVEERTADYLEEKRKCEELLYQLLPRSVACQLIRGESVTAEAFDNVTIYFSDIVGFTSLSAESTPMQVVDLLNDLYTCFDSIIENFDVYKVETIGDAYMVVSGLPGRNGCLHAREIARMSLALLDTVVSFTIRHRSGEPLKLRIGMHTGPCVAGVVGLKMPRYCLFGDTVNTASRMESNGAPLKIHVSPSTKEVLDTFGTFKLTLRGEVEMKGKGKMTTYWLDGEEPQSRVNSQSHMSKDPKM